MGMVYFYGGAPALNWLVGVPLLIVVQFLVIYGLALVIAMVNAFFRDMGHIISVCLSLLFWLTPIIYPLTAVPEKYRPFLALNPFAYLVQCWRDIFLKNTINWDYIGIALISALIIFPIGIFIFKKLDYRLDEVL